MLKANQPDGFDCPGCAWGDPAHGSSFEFCENGVKAVAWESTDKRLHPDFFKTHTVTELRTWTDYEVERAGRLTNPMRYDAATDRYVQVTWDEAFSEIGSVLRGLDSPDRAEFYTSGRASNEAAYIYQLFVRLYGTNNFPDCSNMCHEASGVALEQAVGIGKGSVLLDDFEKADAIFVIGQNPGTNHPRMLGDLRRAALRGAKIAVFNPVREKGLERFADPQDKLEMITGGSTAIANEYYQVRLGGDMAAIRGMAKAVFAADDAAIAAGHASLLDRAFLKQHTAGFESYCRGRRCDELGSDRRPVRNVARGPRRPRENLPRVDTHHLHLGHGRDAASPLGRDDPRNRELPVPARQRRPARHRPLPGAWPLQRPGRSDGRHQREAVKGIP